MNEEEDQQGEDEQQQQDEVKIENQKQETRDYSKDPVNYLHFCQIQLMKDEDQEKYQKQRRMKRLGKSPERKKRAQSHANVDRSNCELVQSAKKWVLEDKNDLAFKKQELDYETWKQQVFKHFPKCFQYILSIY